MALPTEPTKNGDGGGQSKKEKESMAGASSSFNRDVTDSRK